MLAKRKFNTIENLITQVLIDMEINHEEFMKENVRNVSKKQENRRLNSENSKKITCL